MITPEKFEEQLRKFPRKYVHQFNRFWRWKLRTESGDGHILDAAHLRTTHRLLKEILVAWQTYRGARFRHEWRTTLLDALANISEDYYQIRAISLLDFDRANRVSLDNIWHELGRIKEATAERTHGAYYIISICKPLLLLWGQTPAFDNNIRRYCQHCTGSTRANYWNFNDWYQIMTRLQAQLQNNSRICTYFTQRAQQNYGSAQPTPYGRYLDIYYWSEA